jgi:hypothetical protein
VATLVFPTVNSTNWHTTYEPILQGHEDRITSVEASAGSGGSGVTGGKVGWIMLDDATGTDDARLTTKLNEASVATYPPVLRLGNRNHAFATPRTIFTGTRVAAPDGYNNPERNGQTKMSNRCSLSMVDGWWRMPATGDVFSTMWQNLSVTGGSTSVFISQSTGTGTLYCANFRDISTSHLKGVLGTYETKLLMTACVADGGRWNVGNSYDTAFHIGGSDNTLWPAGLLLDSGVPFNTATAGKTGHPHLWANFLTKTTIGKIYMTSEGPWGGILQSGSAYNSSASANPGGPLFWEGLRLEGRNKDAPCYGSIFRLNGGSAYISQTWFAYGMSSPSSQGHSPTDAGLVHVYGSGRIFMNQVVFDRATGVGISSPVVYAAAGSKVGITQVGVGTSGGVWGTLPEVHAVDGTAAVTHDGTVTVVDV